MTPYVGVRFQGGDETIYSYRNHMPDLVVGDLAVVETPDGAFKIVFICSLKLTRNAKSKATKWLVDRVRLDKYRALSALVPPPEQEE